MYYYTFNIGDYASHTKGLTLLEDLAYRRLLDEYYLNERALNGCSTDVARSVGMREHLKEVQYVLQRFFTLNDKNEWINKRVEEEIQSFKDKRTKQSLAGKASAERRSGKRITDVEQTLNRRTTNVQPTNNQITNKHTKEKIVKKENPAAESLPVANATQQQKRGNRLPTDWQPSDAEIQFCENERPDLNPRSVAEQFVDYWTAATGAKSTKMDWSATWRNWVRNQRRSAAQADTRTEHQKREDATTRAIFGEYLHQGSSSFDNLKTIDGDFYEATKKLG